MGKIELKVIKAGGLKKFTLKGEPCVLRQIVKRLRRGNHLTFPKIGKVRRVKK